MPSTLARTRHRGGSRLPAILILMVVVIGAVLGYRHFFNRAGEGAIKLIPSDALMVFTLDTQPSPEQVPTFTRIANSFHDEGADRSLDEGLTGMLAGSPVAKEMRPLLKPSGVVALFRGARGVDVDPILLVALNDASKANQVLAKYGTRGTQGAMEYYSFAAQNSTVGIVNNYLVLCEKPATLARIVATSRGETPSIDSLAEYQTARKALPGDANFMMFISPSGTQWVGDQSKSGGVAHNPLAGIAWVTMGITIRDKGLQMDFQMPVHANPTPGEQELGRIAPINQDLLRKLPGGAYGLIAYSQPGKYWNIFTDSVKDEPQISKPFNDGVAQFEKETGLSVPRDIVPALNGHLVMAVYPDANGESSSVDGIILIDDAEGANPAALAEKLRGYIEGKASEGGGKSLHLVSTQRNGATVWGLSPEDEAEFRKGMNESQHPGANPSGSPAAPTDNPLTRNKTITYAQVGKTVIMASSSKMLDKAIASYNGSGGSIADDAAYKTMFSEVPSGSQGIMMVQLNSIMNAIRPFMGHSMSASDVNSLVGMFGGGDNGFVIGQRYDGKTQTATMFFPLDYVKMFHAIGMATKSAGGNGGQNMPPNNSSMPSSGGMTTAPSGGQ